MRVHGTVQGVGFRPYVYRLAAELALTGFVFNDAHGVVAEVRAGLADVPPGDRVRVLLIDDKAFDVDDTILDGGDFV